MRLKLDPLFAEFSICVATLEREWARHGFKAPAGLAEKACSILLDFTRHQQSPESMNVGGEELIELYQRSLLITGSGSCSDAVLDVFGEELRKQMKD
ncbi:MAG TPA: hypothetical protein VFM23_10265 [Gemmatimonadales bacterium]|nr:hypothetical protein [Gemmatimonadales bacterium]